MAVRDTERLHIRPYAEKDAEAAFAIYGDPEVVRYLGAGKPQESVETQRETLRKIIERDKEFGGKFGMWALEEKATGLIAGSVLLKPLPGSENIEVGWHLGRAHWGKGYATESAREAIRHGFDEVGLETIYALVFPENERSLKVCERLRLRYMGLTEDYYEKRLSLFSISRSE